MPAQQNKATVRRLFEDVWNKNDLDVAKDIIHDDYKSGENITLDVMRGLGITTCLFIKSGFRRSTLEPGSRSVFERQ
jgi:hypothetical protein